jgi:hypothetical protein
MDSKPFQPFHKSCDGNSHHVAWGGNTVTYCRGAALLEYIAYSNLKIVNLGSEPNVCHSSQITCYRYYVVFGQYMAGDSELEGFQGRPPNNKV